jgi:hypothetical protein
LAVYYYQGGGGSALSFGFKAPGSLSFTDNGSGTFFVESLKLEISYDQYAQRTSEFLSKLQGVSGLLPIVVHDVPVSAVHEIAENKQVASYDIHAIFDPTSKIDEVLDLKALISTSPAAHIAHVSLTDVSGHAELNVCSAEQLLELESLDTALTAVGSAVVFYKLDSIHLAADLVWNDNDIAHLMALTNHVDSGGTFIC